MGEMGFGYGEVEKRGIVSPVAGVSVSYKKPVLFDDEVEITVSVKSTMVQFWSWSMNFIMQREMRAVRQPPRSIALQKTENWYH